MSVKIRLKRFGRRHRPFFRVNIVDSRAPRDGKVIENIGHFDPIEKDATKQLVLDKERAQFWLDKGAVPSDTVAQILSKVGIKTSVLKEKADRRDKARAIARKKGLPFTKAEKEAVKKAAEAKKAEEKK